MPEEYEAASCDCGKHPKDECVPMARYYPDEEVLVVQSRRYGDTHTLRVPVPLDIWKTRNDNEGGRE